MAVTPERNDFLESNGLVLPPELVLGVTEAGIDDSEFARVLSQVCSLTRRLALPALFTTLSPVIDSRSLVRLPKHARPYVRNVWLTDGDGAGVSDTAARTSWLWSTAHNLAFSGHFLAACGDLPLASEAPTCRRVTILGDEVVFFWQRAVPLLAEVTHMHVVGEFSTALVSLCFALANLRRLALCVSGWHNRAQVVGVLALLEHRPHLEMVVLMFPEVDDVEHLATRVRITTGINERLYMLPAAQTETDVRAQWEAAADGAEDIWERAARLKAAVARQDSEVIKQFW